MESENNESDRSYEDLKEKYHSYQLGYITEYLTPVNCDLPLSDAIRYIKNNEDFLGLAVEEYDKIIGIISRDTFLELEKSQLLKGKPIKAYLENDTQAYDALNFCEKALYEIINIEDRQVNNLIIYEGTHFFGFVPVNNLIRHVSEIRETSYKQAHYIQQFFLEKSIEKIDGIDFAPFIKMAHEIGGDFYHIREIAKGKYIFTCFDVASKDIAASLTTGLLSAFFVMYFTLINEEYNPLHMIDVLNSILIEQTPGDIFATGILLYFDLIEKTVHIFNHGYSPLYVCIPTGKGVAKMFILNPNYQPLGITKDSVLASSVKKIKIVPHTKFFFYSDGLLDAINLHGTRFGEQRIKNFIKENISLKPSVFMDNLKTEYEKFCNQAFQVDDITAIMIEVT